MKMIARKYAVAVLAATSVTVASCGSGGGSGAPAPTLTPPNVVATDPPVSGYAAALQSPLAAYDTSSDKTFYLLWTAQRAMRISCVRAKGFTEYDGQDMSPGQAPSASQNALRVPAGPWGYLGAETASTRGFKQSVDTNVNAPTALNLPEDELTVSRACFDEAQKKLTPPSAGSNFVRQLVDEASGYTMRDSRVVAARKQWGSCMSNAGYNYSDPDQLAQKNWGRDPAGPPITEEVATAKADQKCTDSSGLARIYFPVDWGYQRQLIERDSQQLAAYQDQLRTRVAEAEKIAASGDAD
jgi:hypothetical protein